MPAIRLRWQLKKRKDIWDFKTLSSLCFSLKTFESSWVGFFQLDLHVWPCGRWTGGAGWRRSPPSGLGWSLWEPDVQRSLLVGLHTTPAPGHPGPLVHRGRARTPIPATTGHRSSSQRPGLTPSLTYVTWYERYPEGEMETFYILLLYAHTPFLTHTHTNSPTRITAPPVISGKYNPWPPTLPKLMIHSRNAVSYLSVNQSATLQTCPTELIIPAVILSSFGSIRTITGLDVTWSNFGTEFRSIKDEA